VIADPNGRFPVAADNAGTLNEAQTAAENWATSRAPGNYTTDLLPSELSLDATKKVGGST
jgi:hypothetical protein